MWGFFTDPGLGAWRTDLPAACAPFWPTRQRATPPATGPHRSQASPPPDTELVRRDRPAYARDGQDLRSTRSSSATSSRHCVPTDSRRWSGKTGTGKTEFVKAFARGLEKALAGTGDEVHLVDVEVGEETAEHDLIGYFNLDGAYVPSSVIERLNSGDPDRDIYIVLLDEMNLAPVDTYAGKLIASMRTTCRWIFPAHAAGGAGATTTWLPPRGACIVGTMNSYLEDPTRKMLSRPVTRRTQPIEMPDSLREDRQGLQADVDEPAATRRGLDKHPCRLLLDQRAERLLEIGTSILDGDRVSGVTATSPRGRAGTRRSVGEAGRRTGRTAGGGDDSRSTSRRSRVRPDQRLLTMRWSALDLQKSRRSSYQCFGAKGGLSIVLDSALPAPTSLAPRMRLGRCEQLADENQNRIKPRF